jgi:hypothetical protein
MLSAGTSQKHSTVAAVPMGQALKENHFPRQLHICYKRTVEYKRWKMGNELTECNTGLPIVLQMLRNDALSVGAM